MDTMRLWGENRRETRRHNSAGGQQMEAVRRERLVLRKELEEEGGRKGCKNSMEREQRVA